MSEGVCILVLGWFLGVLSTVIIEFIYCALIIGGEDDE